MGAAAAAKARERMSALYLADEAATIDALLLTERVVQLGGGDTNWPAIFGRLIACWPSCCRACWR